MNTAGRAYEAWVTDEVKARMEKLLAAAQSNATSAYREWMHALGTDLGAHLSTQLPAEGEVLLITTVEDADFLGRGVLGALQPPSRVKVFCYWNERDSARDTAPIISKYEEPLEEGRVAAVVIVKSIISGACVVRTNLIEALRKIRHSVPVFVVAPVMHVDAKKKLRREFHPSIADRFSYVVCALDREREGEIIRPGIGGSVYELLGLGDKHTKNRVRPQMLAERHPG